MAFFFKKKKKKKITTTLNSLNEFLLLILTGQELWLNSHLCSCHSETLEAREAGGTQLVS